MEIHNFYLKLIKTEIPFASFYSEYIYLCTFMCRDCLSLMLIFMSFSIYKLLLDRNFSLIFYDNVWDELRLLMVRRLDECGFLGLFHELIACLLIRLLSS